MINAANTLVKKEEFRWSFMKKGSQVLNVCTRMLFLYGFTAALAGVSTEAFANPANGTVVGGSASISSSGTTETINQSSENAIINWNSFNIAKGETTQFIQPNSSATALNRIFNSGELSYINGNLTANGHIIIINPNGVIIGKNGNIKTAGFIATSADIANGAFMNNSTGKYNFNIAGNTNAKIVNKGTITVADEGLVAFVAPSVRNDGIITGKLSKIQLGAADTFGVDLYGDGLISLAVGKSTKLKVVNNGSIITPGGQVLMTAAAASNVVNSVINNTGVIEANALDNVNGQIVLKAPGATTNVSGTLQAKGGNIETSGAVVNIAARAKIEAANWLIDPNTVDIVNTAGSVSGITYLTVNTLLTALQGDTNVIVQTSGSSAGAGNINVDAAIALANGTKTTTTPETKTVSDGDYYDASGDVVSYNPHNSSYTKCTSSKGCVDNYDVTSTSPVSYDSTLTLDTSGTTAGAVTINDGISATGGSTLGLIVNSASDINVNAAVSTNGSAVSLTSNNGQILSNSAGTITTSGGAFSATAASAITDNGAITTNGGNVLLQSINGSVAINNGITTNGGTLSVLSPGAITDNADISTGAGAVTLASNNSSITSGVSDSITSTSGDIAVSAATSIHLKGNVSSGAGSIRITAAHNGAGNVEVAGVNSTSGSITVGTTDGTLMLDEGLTSTSGDIDASASGALTVSDAISTGGSAWVTLTSPAIALNGNVTAGGNVTLDGPVTTTDTGTLALTSTGSSVSTQGITDDTGNVTIAAANAVTTGDVNTVYNINISAGSGGISAGNLTVDSGPTNIWGFAPVGSLILTTTNGGSISTGSLSVSNQSGGTSALDVTSAGSLTVDGDITAYNLDDTTSLFFVPASAATNVNISAKNDIIIDGAISGTATAKAFLPFEESSSSVVSIVSSAGDLWLSGGNPVSTANTANQTDAYNGTAYNQTTKTNSNQNSAQLILSGANHLYTLDVTPDAASTTYDGAALNTTAYSDSTGNYAITGFQNGQTIATSGLTLSGAMAFSSPASTVVENAGTYTQAVGNLGLTTTSGNYKLDFINSPTPNDYVIKAEALTVTGVSGTGEAYNGTASDAISGTAILGVGTVYSADEVTLSTTGATATLSSSGNAYNGTGTPNTASTVSFGGYTLSGNTLGNYTLNQPINSTAVITPAVLSVAATQTYNGTTTIASSSFGTNGKIAGVDGQTLTLSGNATSGSANVATYSTANGTLTPGLTLNNGTGPTAGLAANYTLAGGTDTAAITPANLTIYATPDFRTYNGTTASSATAIETGLVTTDASKLTIGPEQFSSANAGLQTLSVGYNLTDASNYTVKVYSSFGIIVPEVITVSTSNVTKTYDGSTSVAGATTGPAPVLVSGKLYVNDSNGDTQDTLSGGTYAFTNANAGIGDKTVKVSGVSVDDGNKGNNYIVIDVNNTTSTINQKQLTATIVGDPSKTYDGTQTAALTGANYNLGGFVSGQGATVTQTAGTYNSPNVVGAATVTASLTGDLTANKGTLLSNYILPTSASGAGSITPLALTASIVGDPTKIYDGGTTAALTDVNYSLGGFVSGEGATVTSAPASGTYNSANVNTATTVNVSGPTGDITATGNGTTLLSNYTLPTSASGTGAITPATLTYTAKPDSITAGITPTGLSGTVTGFVAGENQTTATGGTLNWTTPATASSLPGKYAIDGSGLTANNGNYVFTQAVANATALIINAVDFSSDNSAVDGVGRPIISVAGLVIDFYASFQPHQTNPGNINISLKGGDNGGQGGGNLANIEPAAGGNDQSPNGLANIEPAAGGNSQHGQGKGDFACANDFLDGKSCTSQ